MRYERSPLPAPPDGGRTSSTAHVLRGWLTAALVALGLAATATIATAAVTERPIDPVGDPPPIALTRLPVGWQEVVVPDRAPGTVLGELWGVSAGDFYVWSAVPSRTVRPLSEETPGEQTPPDRGLLRTFTSVLLHHAGGTFTPVLSVAQSSPGAVYGTGAGDVYATTYDRNGAVSMWRFDGVRWAPEVLPIPLNGAKHSLTGTTDDVWLRVGAVVLVRTGGAWNVSHYLPVGVGGGGLAYLDDRTVVAPSSCGHCLMQNNEWFAVPEDFTFSGVVDAWGLRAPCGALALYAVGCNADQNGLRVWRFTEAAPGSMTGCWGSRVGTVLSDPPGEGTPGIGAAAHVWGRAADEVYVAGSLEGRGKIYRFDGAAWRDAAPLTVLPEVMGVSGAGRSETWFSLADGRLLRYERPNNPPNVVAALATPAMVWPPNESLVPVAISGVTDAEGDPVTITVTGITQDEALVLAGTGIACPDGEIAGGQALVRAERSWAGNGRVYQITFTADDGRGGVVTGHVEVCVPLCPCGGCVNDGQAFVSTGPCSSPIAKGTGLRVVPAGAQDARVEFALAERGEVTLDVHDVAGRLVTRLASGELPAGEHRLSWSHAGARPGVYFVRLRGAGFALTKTVVLNR